MKNKSTVFDIEDKAAEVAALDETFELDIVPNERDFLNLCVSSEFAPVAHDPSSACQAPSSAFASLLQALAAEHERVQKENARLLAELANHDSSPATTHGNDKAVQDPLEPSENMTKTISQKSDPSLGSSQGAPQDDFLVSQAESEAKFEMSPCWTEYPEIFHHKLRVSHQKLPVAVRGLTKRMLGDPYLDEARKSCFLMIHPDSKIRHVWIPGCIFLLLFDLVVVPLDICFGLERTAFTMTAHWVSMVYWSLDIIMNFLTGVWFDTHLEMRIQRIAKVYAKTWFVFDVLLLLPDYIALVMTEFPVEHISILRMMRWGRFMRFFRLARLSKVTFLKPIIRAIAVHYHLSRTYVEVLRDWMLVTCVMLIFLHWESCFWYAFGAAFDEGWVHANSLESASIGKLYVVSMHWGGSRLIGSNGRYALKTEPELVMDIFLMLLSLAIAGWMVAVITVLTFTKTTSKPFNLWRSSVNYASRHELTRELEQRLIKWLEVSDFGNIGEIAEDENTLLCTVPKSLREDLLFEARIPFLTYKTFIADMTRINERAARHLCYEALTESVLAVNEVVFDKGDAGQAMRFISHGCFEYKYSNMMCKDLDTEWQLEPPAAISEAVLWTAWEHTGFFRAVFDPRLLILDHELFAVTVKNHPGSFVHAVRYAKQFVQKLNQEAANPHDLTAFEDISADFLNNNVFSESDSRHFIFISHYKVEAGTEATLMFSALKKLLMHDHGHVANNMLLPLFIDSENLTDLALLKEHVIKTNVIVLLLTPGVLSRPWCLVEIATAIKHSVKIVLVDIQRPGCKFQYPDDQFYEKFVAGKTVDPAGISLLESEGISLEKLAEGLRRIFQKISLPFSPHRIEEVREAELHDILKRCNFEFSKSTAEFRATASKNSQSSSGSISEPIFHGL